MRDNQRRVCLMLFAVLIVTSISFAQEAEPADPSSNGSGPFEVVLADGRRMEAVSFLRFQGYVILNLKSGEQVGFPKDEISLDTLPQEFDQTRPVTVPPEQNRSARETPFFTPEQRGVSRSANQPTGRNDLSQFARTAELNKDEADRIQIVGRARSVDEIISESMEGERKANPTRFNALTSFAEMALAQESRASKVLEALGRYKNACSGSVTTYHSTTVSSTTTRTGAGIADFESEGIVDVHGGPSFGYEAWGTLYSSWAETEETTEDHYTTSSTSNSQDPFCLDLESTIQSEMTQLGTVVVSTIASSWIDGVFDWEMDEILMHCGIPPIAFWQQYFGLKSK